MLATEILTTDHNTVIALIDELKDRHNNERGNRDLFRELDLAIRLHLRLEEEIFYPALEADPEFKGLMEESVPEHNETRRVLDDMEAINNPAHDDFQKLLTRLRFSLRQHAEKEESDIFPRALGVLGADRLAELGTQIDAVKADAAGMSRSANMK